MPGGPVGVNFNALMRIEPGNGRLTSMGVPPGAAISEPVYVPSDDPEHGGWLLSVVDLPNGPLGQVAPHDYLSELWVIEADEIEKGPIAKVKTGLALRSQVHGAWVNRAKMGASTVK
jgi:carotenoid cleavage dioxygenase